MHGEIFRIFFGVRDPAQYRPVLKQIEADLNECHILGMLSSDIRKSQRFLNQLGLIS